MSTLFPSGLGGLGCCHIPEAWAGLVPKDGLSRSWRSWGGRASPWALPHGPGEPLPLCISPQPQDAGTSSCSETLPLLPKDVQPLGWKSSEKPCGPHVSWCWSFPPPASFLRVAPPMDESTLPRVVLQELGFVQVSGVGKEEGMGHKL